MTKISDKDLEHLKWLMTRTQGDEMGELIHWIKKLSKLTPNPNTIGKYYDYLIFGLAHPGNPGMKKAISQELARITQWLLRNAKKHEETLNNSGLINTHIYSYFSYETTKWLIGQKHEISIDQYPEEETSLNDLLIHTLPASERDICGFGFTNRELLSSLGIKKVNLLPFIMSQMEKLQASDGIRDYFFNRLQLTIKLNIRQFSLTREGNRLKTYKDHYQRDWLKRIDSIDHIKNGKFQEQKLTGQERKNIMDSSRISLVMLQRETDPVKYMDPAGIRFFEMGRGISIALFSMKAEFQLYPEIYIGHTLYKNGFPAAYGGAWIFGRYALFGVNIFEWCRGGESSLMVTELLTLYHHTMGVECIEVEPYQYGKDNPEGISSGAFWFYYRMGFRPVRRDLAQLARREEKKILENPGYKSNQRTLLKFTEGNIRMDLKKTKLIKGANIKSMVGKMVQKEYQSDRLKAEIESIKWMTGQLSFPCSKMDKTALTEIAMMNRAVGFPVAQNQDLLKKMLQTRGSKPHLYQNLILQWLEKAKIKTS